MRGPARRLIKKPCDHQAKHGYPCEIHEPGETDRGADARWSAAVVEVDLPDHKKVEYDPERSYLLLMMLLSLWPEQLPRPNVAYFTRSGGLRLLFIFSRDIEYLEEYEAIVRGLHQGLADVSAQLLKQGLGYIDDSVHDGYRLWKAPWVTTDKGSTFDRPILLLSTTDADPDALPQIYVEEEQQAVNDALAQAHLLVARSMTGTKDPVLKAARYLDAVPCEVGNRFNAAVILIRGFALDDDPAWALLNDWQRKNGQSWPEREWRRKIKDAKRMGGRDGCDDVRCDTCEGWWFMLPRKGKTTPIDDRTRAYLAKWLKARRSEQGDA